MHTMITVLLLLTTCVAQAEVFKAKLDLHLAEQFDSSIDNGGKVGVSRYGAELRLDMHMFENDDLQLRFAYQRDEWDFSGSTGMGGDDPWDQVNTVDLALQWTHQLESKTQMFGGPLIRWSGDAGANQSDSDVFGGLAGIAHVYSDTLVLGGGVGIIGSLEDDSRLFPVIVIDWKLSDDVRLSSDLTNRFGSKTGVELVWTPREDWTLGVGIAYDYNRFRLDNDGVAPGGVGEATSIPLTLRASYHPSPSVDITVFGGAVFGGELSVIDAAGSTLQTENYDSAGTIGLLARIRF